MNKLILGAIVFVPLSASAQGLFDIAPNDDAIESVNLNYTAGVRVGWDSNINPGSGIKQDSAYASTYIGANGISVTSRSTLEYYGRYVGNYYNKRTEGGDHYTNNISGGVNYVIRINERLRFSTRNHLGYQMEPDFNYGFANTRAANEYFYWFSDNSIGYRFNDKVAAYFGVTFSGVDYGSDNKDSNRMTITPYMQWRYQLSPRTVLTAGYRYSMNDNTGIRDSVSHILTAGVEHRVNPTSVFVVRAGAQLHEIDGGQNTASPYLEAAYRTRLSERTQLRTFARYGITDYDTAFEDGSYELNHSLQFGMALTHQITERLVLNCGANYIFNDYEDSPDGLLNADSHLLNVYAGLNYRINENLYWDTTVNQTWSSSGIRDREYDRTRLSMGISYSF